jgi:hypothetical protein
MNYSTDTFVPRRTQSTDIIAGMTDGREARASQELDLRPNLDKINRLHCYF